MAGLKALCCGSASVARRRIPNREERSVALSSFLTAGIFGQPRLFKSSNSSLILHRDLQSVTQCGLGVNHS